MKVLVAYASKHGATAGIADHIADALRQAGLDTTLRPVEEVDDLRPYDAYVIGSAIYAGSWLKDATSLIEENTALLVDRPVWLFSSGPVDGPVQDEEEQPRQLADFRRTVDVRGHALFGGRLDPDLLGFGERMMMKAVKAKPGDSRNWEEIAGWAREVAAALRGGWSSQT